MTESPMHIFCGQQHIIASKIILVYTLENPCHIMLRSDMIFDLSIWGERLTIDKQSALWIGTGVLM
jgi:hypothetical protein